MYFFVHYSILNFNDKGKIWNTKNMNSLGLAGPYKYRVGIKFKTPCLNQFFFPIKCASTFPKHTLPFYRHLYVYLYPSIWRRTTVGKLFPMQYRMEIKQKCYTIKLPWTSYHEDFKHVIFTAALHFYVRRELSIGCCRWFLPQWRNFNVFHHIL